MKFSKSTLLGSILFVPALALGIAQQNPANPPRQQMQQEQAKPAMGSDTVGTIVRVRHDSFSVKQDSDGSEVGFYIAPEFRSSWSSELVIGNRIRVSSTPGATAHLRNASRISAEPSLEANLDADREVDIDADIDVDDDSLQADLDADREVDTDIDADIDVDNDSVTATIDKDTALDSEPNRFDTHNDAEDDDAIADNSLADDDDAIADNSLADDTDYDNDKATEELPITASSLPKIASLGLLALLGAAVLAFVRKL